VSEHFNLPMTGDGLVFPRSMQLHVCIFRVGITILKWLFQSLHDFHAIATFDYILPLMVSKIVPWKYRFTHG
jgi:hypothetical protein